MIEQSDNKEIVLSIVIPTKNRQQYCIESVRHIISLNLNKTEIVIQDNSDRPLLEHVLNDNNLIQHVKYHYNSNVLSFVDNFSEAISLCTGKYICMIGDDDSVLPNIVDIVDYADKNCIDAIVPQLQAYHWPSEKPLKPAWRNGFLSTLPFRTNKYQRLNIKESLIHLIENYFQDYQRFSVPRIYHGLVKRDCLESVKKRCGVYFAGLTPDMFMSIALCFTVKNAVTYTKPITISGICPRSGSADSATGRHTGELKDAPHFRGHKAYNWIEYIPYIYTVETIWAETGIQALRLMQQNGYERYFDVKQFILYLITKYPQFEARLLEIGSQYGLSNEDVKSFRNGCRKRMYYNRLCSILKRGLKLEYAHKYYNVESIDSACKILSKIYKINIRKS